MACPEQRCPRFPRILTHLFAVGGVLAGSQLLVGATAFACGNAMRVKEGVFWPLVFSWMAAGVCSGVVLVTLRIIERFKSPLISDKGRSRVVMAIFALATFIAAVAYAATTDVEDWRFFDKTLTHEEAVQMNSNVTF
ncbi:MAG: hypothetical protein ACLFVJ_12390 [Persicimonas sp.]